MIYKSFRISIFIRVTIIVTLALLLAFVIINRQMLFVPLSISLVLSFAVINLILYIEKSNKDLTHFLLSIRQGAYNEWYTSGNRGKQYEALSDALNEIVREFAKLNQQKELHYQYLQALNENIGVGILSFDVEGKLMMMNLAGKKLLNLPSFSSIDHFKYIDKNLHQVISHIKPGQRTTVKVFIGDEQYQLNIQLKEIILQNAPVRIILLQNLNNEFEEKEIEAWHQLMSVLTHEIMNSVTPIISLADAVQNLLTDRNGKQKDVAHLSSENMDDIYSSISTISSRSHGLLKFINAYKAYSKPLELSLEITELNKLVARIADLLAPDFQKFHIRLEFDGSSAVRANADVVLIEQVLINLIKNAIEAVPHDGSGAIKITIRNNTNNRVSISVADNGEGMDEETMLRIFIPFFTTKTKGSGIGLSLSRQIMKMHNGQIRAQSTLGHGSVFTIEWP